LAYCSPEQATHQPLSHKTDIWSWGVSVLEMFVGEVTWITGLAAPEVLASHQRVNPDLPEMPKEVRSLLSWCFLFQPEARPATMKVVALELQGIYERLRGQAYAREAPTFRERGEAELYSQAHSLQALGLFEKALAAWEQGIQPTVGQAAAHLNKGTTQSEME